MNDHSIRGEKTIERTGDSVTLEFSVPRECDFFDGHFPEFHLLPAVGQFEIVTRYASEYLGVGRAVSSIKRIKFSSPLLPDSFVRLSLNVNRAKGEVTFRAEDARKEGKVYSSGSFTPAAD